MIVKLIIGFLFSGIAIYLSLQNTDLSLFIKVCSDVGLIFWLGVGGIFLMQQLLRAFRQQRIIQTQVPDYSLFESHTLLCISFLCIKCPKTTIDLNSLIEDFSSSTGSVIGLD